MSVLSLHASKGCTCTHGRIRQDRKCSNRIHIYLYICAHIFVFTVCCICGYSLYMHIFHLLMGNFSLSNFSPLVCWRIVVEYFLPVQICAFCNYTRWVKSNMFDLNSYDLVVWHRELFLWLFAGVIEMSICCLETSSQ